MRPCDPQSYRIDQKKYLAKCVIVWIWISLTSCTYSPNYSKVDSSNHSITNNNYTARQMAVGLPNQADDSMVSTSTEDGENTSEGPTATQPTTYTPPQIERSPSPSSNPRSFNTSYVFPNPFVAIVGIFANAIKNFNDRMEYIATHPYNASSSSYIYQPNQNSYARAYQQSLQRRGVYGPQNSLETQAYYNTAQALNRNR